MEKFHLIRLDNNLTKNRTVEKFLISKIVPHTIKIQYASNCIPFSKYCKIVILANVITVQVNNITVNKMPLGRSRVGMLIYGFRGESQSFK